ncbi:MAG: hypothetical protein M1820_005357 [Bogoriella megaspora]|nr:MAG: hypothetical protein M1820_005357 [Bogoriella megaspora]
MAVSIAALTTIDHSHGFSDISHNPVLECLKPTTSGLLLDYVTRNLALATLCATFSSTDGYFHLYVGIL